MREPKKSNFGVSWLLIKHHLISVKKLDIDPIL